MDTHEIRVASRIRCVPPLSLPWDNSAMREIQFAISFGLRSAFSIERTSRQRTAEHTFPLQMENRGFDAGDGERHAFHPSATFCPKSSRETRIY